MKNILVSVIIPTYGRPKTLQRAIESVRRQTHKTVEIVVVDDNNPESEARIQTEQVMQQYQNHSNILYLQHDRNRNGSAARNTGFKASCGDYIMFLDDDDEFMPEKISLQLHRMQSLDDSWAACYTAYVRKRNNKTIMHSGENREGYLLVEELGRNLFVHAGSNLMIRRNVVVEVNGFDESFKRNQDIEFLVRVLQNYKLAFVNYLGLIVNVSSSIEKNRNNNYLDITQDYINKFSATIFQLSQEKKNKIFLLINLQIVRYYISKMNLYKCISLIYCNKISIFHVIRYLTHLIKRWVTRSAYGFRI